MKMVVDKASLVSVADAIREKGNTTDKLEFPNGFVDGINAIESGGGGTEEIEQLIDQSGVLDSTEGTVEDKVGELIDRAEDEKSWYVESGNWTNKFRDFFWQSTTIKKLPRLNFQNANTLRSFASSCSVESIDYYINSAKATDGYQAFYNNKKLRFIYGVDLSQCRETFEIFKDCPLLETIQEPLDFSASTTTNTGHFWNDRALKYVTFVPKSIKLSMSFAVNISLIGVSVQSIFDGLDPSVTGKTLTLPSAFENAEAEAVVSANIEVVDGVTRIKGKEGWSLVR